LLKNNQNQTTLSGQIIATFVTLSIVISSGCSVDQCEIKDMADFIETADLSSFENCLGKGFNPNSVSANGESLLFLSIKNGDSSFVKALIENRVDVFGYAPADLPILQFAHEFNSIGSLIISSQISYYNNANDSTYLEIFQLAIEQNNPQLVLEMIENSSMSVSSKLSNSILPVPWAAFSNSLEAMEVLLIQGANPDDEFDTRSALIITTMYGNVDMVELLLNNDADIDNYEGTHMTALMFAITNSYPDIVDLLLKNEADITLKDLNGKTALDYANISDNEKIKAIFE